MTPTYAATLTGQGEGTSPNGAGPGLDGGTGNGGGTLDNGARPPRATALRSKVADAARHYAGQWLVWAILAFLVAVPVGAFLVQVFVPRLFDQGTSWFTLSNLTQAFQGHTFLGLFNSLWVSAVVCVLDLVIGGGVAWLSMRTTIGGRRIWPGMMWGLLLVPTWLMAQGWQYLTEPNGVLSQFGMYSPLVHHIIFSPIGVVLVDSLATAPYAYLTLSAALGGLGSQFEEAVRVHGGGRVATFRVVVPVLAPAVLASVALVFVETMSDYGVASTLAFQSRFTMATYGIYQAIDNLPAQFPVAGAISILLLASAAIPLALQSRVTRGRSYAILSGRTRPATRYRLGRAGKWSLTSVVGLFFLVALGAPALGAFAGSFVANLGSPLGGQSLTLANYREVFSGDIAYSHSIAEGASGTSGPVLLSTMLAAITATITVVVGLAVARLLVARRPGRFTKAGDLLILGSIALPGIVLGAGYIFAFNLPIASRLGVDLYETLPLLVMGYLATSIPTTSRIMMGPVAQVHGSLMEAGRVHGARAFSALRSCYIPVVSRVLVLVWLVTLTKTFWELPISQLLYPPGQETVSVAIDSWNNNYHPEVGAAMTVVALGACFVVIGLVLGGFRLMAPKGWRRIGGWRSVA